MILIVTYDLRSPKDYHVFYEAVKQQGTWWHYMASTWLLSTQKTPQEVVDAILPHMDAQDLLFVCELTNKYQGRLPKPAWDWIKQELPEYSFLNALAAMSPPPPVPGSLADLLKPPKKEEPFSPFSVPPPWIKK
jgi:hypothetical protein